MRLSITRRSLAAADRHTGRAQLVELTDAKALDRARVGPRHSGSEAKRPGVGSEKETPKQRR